MLEPKHNYDVPPIVKIGLVGTQSYAAITGYADTCDKLLKAGLETIKGVQIIPIPFDDSKFGGAVAYDRAAWLCQPYGVDAPIMTDLNKLEIPGLGTSSHVSTTISLNLSISSVLIEAAGGSTWWKKDVDDSNTHQYYEIEQSQSEVIGGDLHAAIGKLIDDLKSSGKLKGGHVE